jgi:hypothetical protein
MKILVLSTFAVVVFLLLPVRVQELYKCPPGGQICPGLYSTQENQIFIKTVVSRVRNEIEYDGISVFDLIRNSGIFLLPVAVSVIKRKR